MILPTGGTIAGQADARAANAYNAAALGPQQLIAAVPGITKLADLSAEQIAAVASQDMNDAIWFKLAKRIQEAVDKNEADGFVITHGTDTMEETAFFLDLILNTDKPVVLVGSMRPSTAMSADGPGNLYEAVKVAADPQSRSRGVMVVMNEKIDSARGVTKTQTTAVETMQSPNLGAMGYVDPASVRFLQPAHTRAKSPLKLPNTPELPRVEIIYSHSNMDGQQIEHAIADNAKGIVLASKGDGNTSKQALEALQKAVAKGIVVVRSTRVTYGYVNRNVEVNDDESGFVTSLDLNPQKSRVLTQLLIANSITSAAEVQKAFAEHR
ncbi:asparaginase [Pseudomonas gingeri]|uniref:asparaginase n=1 Tax=Pseudomonas gingeri TaxID=117681 RepID=UPI0015A45FC4|nr:asparaginase [Pseudomonas gingeri]NWD66823.1 asparaginase [Pseudomonas gingeri]